MAIVIDVSMTGVDRATLPDGTFPGKWTGNIAKAMVNNKLLRFVSVVGVKGVDVPCRIVISGGTILVETDN